MMTVPFRFFLAITALLAVSDLPVGAQPQPSPPTATTPAAPSAVQPGTAPAAVGAGGGAVASSPTTAANADWPCVQHKQAILTAPQMWDGPSVAADGARSDDEAVRKLVPLITSRRHEMEEVDKALKEFAEASPPAERDARLTDLFEAALAEINTRRASIINGIERFQRQQVVRAKKLEDEGIALAALQSKSATGDASVDPAKLADAQQRYDWDARVFQERQQNIPIACEIPVLIEQRAFALAQSIRALMAN